MKTANPTGPVVEYSDSESPQGPQYVIAQLYW